VLCITAKAKIDAGRQIIAPIRRLFVPTPVSGDKIFTPYDAKPTRRDENRAGQSSTASAGKQPETRTADDSVELRNSSAEHANPPNTNIGSPTQARQVLGDLLAAMQRDPAQASAAHGQTSQPQVDAALASPIT
jgi:hypothetical protein